jgi:hypothetical protein
MSFLEEQRKQILDENNTAQADFLDVLEHLPPTATTIDVRIPLSGDVDCDILEKCNFTGITAILFAPGNITSIKNLPEGVTKIICAENYLTEVPQLPASIVELDLQKNAIRRVESGALPAELKELNLSDNQIHTLEDLPEGLEVLRLNNNRMRVLKLGDMVNLRILHCSSNPMLVIENVPDTLEEFESDNDIIREINNAREKSAPVEKRADYQESLRTYFEMKKAYMDGVRKNKREAFLSSKSKKEARTKISGLKPKCSYCERPVGSIYENKGRTYIARCGDTKHPCPFHIELFGGEYGQVSDMMEQYQRSIDFTKQAIIVDKLDVLFQYMSEKDGVELFKDNLDYYTKQNVHFTELKREYDSFYFDEEREEKLAQKRAKIGAIQDRIRELVQLYKQEENPEILKDAITVYIRELVPEVKNRSIIQNETREMNVNEETKIGTLFQMGWKLNDIEYTFGEYPRVVHFKVK